MFFLKILKKSKKTQKNQEKSKKIKKSQKMAKNRHFLATFLGSKTIGLGGQKMAKK